jgi:TolB-like protein
VFDPRAHELRRGEEKTPIQPQPSAVLAALAAGGGKLVTRAELCRLLWPDGTFVDYEHSLNAAVKRLRVALGDAAGCIQTVPRAGYRLAGTPQPWRGPCAATPRIAVLPFAVLARSPEVSRFCDGLAEELATRLGSTGSGRVTVVARSSAATVARGTLRARDIGTALCASYLIEGAARADDTTMRLTMRLIDSGSEAQVWSGGYDVAESAAGIHSQTTVAAEMVDAVLRCV